MLLNQSVEPRIFWNALHSMCAILLHFAQLTKHHYKKPLACSRRSDSRAWEGVQLNSPPTYHRTLLSECLEQAKKPLEHQ